MKVLLFLRQRGLLSVAVLLATGLVVSISFQNCAPVSFSKLTTESSSVLGCAPGSESVGGSCANPVASCAFDGKPVLNNAQVTAFQNSSVAFGALCVSETRTCTNGVLSGSYNFSSCSVGVPKSCLFNGATIPHSGSATAFLTSTVGAGSTCSSEVRTCNDGMLSGSYQYSSCAPGAAASCLFNGVTVASGNSVVAFSTSSVGFGGTCQQEVRTCNNGILSGSYSQPSCSVEAPASCSFGGRSLANNESVIAYQTSSVPFGSSCISENRTCNNGSLSGTFQNSSCSVGAPAACTFNGTNIPSGGNVVAFASSSVDFGQSCSSEIRTCTDGSLSGSNQFSSCNVGAAKACLFGGKTINSGDSVVAFTSSTAPFGSSCDTFQKSRTCLNGVLSGDVTAVYDSCAINAPASCSFNGRTINNNDSVVAYATSSVAWNQSCSAENRQCSNGTLSGSFTNASCVVAAPRDCGVQDVYYPETNTWISQLVHHGETVNLHYSASNADFRWSCPDYAPRTCTDGSFNPEPDYKMYCQFIGNPGSPLMIELNTSEVDHKPLLFSSQIDGIMFDLLGLNAKPVANTPVRISWYKQSNYFFLVLPNAQGEVKGIDQMFGDNTFGPDKKFAKDGYKALAKYDGMDATGVMKIQEPDGLITAADPVFAQLRLWHDSNYDGIVQKEELFTLESFGIDAIDLHPDPNFKEVDQWGNQTTLKSVVHTSDGRMHLMFDIWFNYLEK